MESEERIKQEMHETRAALADKLECLEQKVAGVVGAVGDVTTVVGDTVESLKNTMHEAKATVEAVQEKAQEGVESVKELFDVNAQVQQHPWLIVGGSVAAGYCLGRFLDTAESRPAASSSRDTPTMSSASNGGSRRLESSAPPPSDSRPGLFAPEIARLKAMALGALFGTAREMLASSLPEPVVHQVKDLIDDVTRKVGGEPIASSAFADLMATPSSSEQGSTPGGSGRRW